MKRLFGAIALAVVAALALTACGSGSSSGNGGGDFSNADVTFAQSMIPHHQQAVAMAKMAKAHASSPEVKKLAEKIEAAQGPEISTMQGWLKDWGKSKASGSMGGMPGMMSGSDMNGLDKATGAAFDKMFLTMMVAHHTGAIEMAKTEQSKGKNADAMALAKNIEKAQTTEIAQMKKMLGS
ncbi:DUF305 domain-containing protein [Nocardioides korecus]